MPETHTLLPGSRRPMPKGGRRVRDLDPNSHVEVTITLKAPDLPTTGAMPQNALTPAEFAKRYSASPENIRKVEEVLRSYGLTIDGVNPTGRSLRVSGTAAAMNAAFRAGLAIYQSSTQGEFRGREGMLSVPTEIAGLVTSVLGLDQRRVARRAARRAVKRTSAATAEKRKISVRGANLMKTTGVSRASASRPLTPSDLERHYNFPSGSAAGQSIAIAEFGSPLHNGSFLPPAYFPDDVAKFCQEQGRPVPNVRTVPLNLAPLTLDQVRAAAVPVQKAVLEETGEVMMDVEIVAALCTAAKIAVYYASWDQKGWVDLLERIIADRPVAVSISYGLAEDSPDWSNSALHAINDTLQAAAMTGITICVSAGDDGSGCDMADTRAHVEFPGSSPFVLSVGGTMWNASGEVVWWDSPGSRTGNGGGSTGGGVSALFARPAWQNVKVQSLNSGAMDGRVVPDVSALAGSPLYELTLLGRSAPNGGTSASAPLWASLIARIDAALPQAKQQRFLAPLLYQKAKAGKTIGAAGCTDITSGDNASHPQPGKGYEAVVGFDAVTGWGVPNGKALLAAL